MSGIAVAGTAPAFPTVRPPTSSGGGGGSSGGSSSGGGSAPTFTPFVDPLLSSDGSAIGSLTGKTAFNVDLQASNNTTIGGKNYTLTMVAELTQRPPSDVRLDINIETPDSSGLPKGMTSVTLLGMVNISKHVTYGWVSKPETVVLTFTVPGTPSADADTAYYLVRYDGSGYYIQNAALKSNDAGTMTFEVSPGTDSGMFTLVTAGSVVLTPTPTPTAAAIALPSNVTKTTDTATSSAGSLSILGVDKNVLLAIIGGTLVTIGTIATLLYMLYFRKLN